MPNVKLTPGLIKTLACQPGRPKTDYYDTVQKGLLLEVRSGGTKTFYQRYRTNEGRTRQFKIAAADLITVSQARIKGRQLLSRLALGEDPQEARRNQRQVPNVQQLFTDRLLPHWQKTRKTWRDVNGVFVHHILPVLGRLKITEITSEEIDKLLADLRDKGYAEATTNRIRSVIYSMFTLGYRWKVPGFSGHNPVRDVAASPAVFRERYLSKAETDRLMDSIKADKNKTASSAVMLILLTGARKREITNARWDDVDLDRRILTVPVSKNGKPRRIVLSAAAVDLLKALPRLAGNPYVFPSRRGGKPFPTLMYQWDRIRKRAGLPDVRIHDLRHSFASYLVNKGYSLYIVQQLLGHSQPKTTQRYAHLAPETLHDAVDFVGTHVGVASGFETDELQARDDQGERADDHDLDHDFDREPVAD